MTEPKNVEPGTPPAKNSNTRFFVIVIIFVAMLIGLIAFEIARK